MTHGVPAGGRRPVVVQLRRARRAGLGAVVALVLAATPVSALTGVPERKLGWSSCLWPAGRVVTVAVDPAFPFPGPSFAKRLGEAAARWSAVLTTTRRKVRLVAGASPAARPGGADILVQYRAPSGGDRSEVLGETYLRRDVDAAPTSDIAVCPDRRPARYTLRAAQIRIAPRSDWFTGPDSVTPAWQRCSGRVYRARNRTLCATDVDFGSTITHELGHALAFYHPETLDQLDHIPATRADSATNAARCYEVTGRFGPQATMCAGQGVWRAEQRTLERWDTGTVHRAYDQ